MKIKKLKFFILLLVIIFFSSGLTIIRDNKDKYENYIIHCVSPGESLWSIACEYNDSKIYNIVSDIMYINDMESENIYPGEELYIPILK